MSRRVKSLALALLPLLAACGSGSEPRAPRPVVLAGASDLVATPQESALTTRRATLRFLTGWAEEQRGAVVRGGQLVVDYDIYRLPQCHGTKTYGMPAWNTLAYVRFQPGGQEFSGSVVQFNADGTFQSKPHEVTVPADATGVEVWFFTSGNGCAGVYDSDLGNNYRFAVEAQGPAAVLWAGDWGGSFSRECTHGDGLADPLLIDSYVMERACKFVDADVYVPGLTDGGTQRPEYVQAQVEYSIDGGPMQYRWLGYQGRVGNNYRWRWTLDSGELAYTSWSQYRFALRYSTDGVSWFRIGLADGPTGGAARTVQRAF